MLLDVLIPATAQPYMIKRLGVEDGISSNYVVGITGINKVVCGSQPKTD